MQGRGMVEILDKISPKTGMFIFYFKHFLMVYYPRNIDNVRDGALSHCLTNNIEHT